MRAGRLRHRITLQQRAITRDSYGGAIETWSDYATSVPAEVWPLSGKEFIAAGAQRGELAAKITIRYDASVTELMRVVYDGVIYEIQAVLPDPTFRRHMMLMCAEGVSDGA